MSRKFVAGGTSVEAGRQRVSRGGTSNGSGGEGSSPVECALVSLVVQNARSANHARTTGQLPRSSPCTQTQGYPSGGNDTVLIR